MAIAGSPEYEKGILARLAVENRILILNVGYRLCPEVQFPTCHRDAKTAIDHIIENPEQYGYDPEKIAIGGVSAGGWVTMGSAILLARDEKKYNEKIKLMILTCPMLGSHMAVKIKKEEAEPWEQKTWQVSIEQPQWNLFTEDLEANLQDPLLIPFNISIDELK